MIIIHTTMGPDNKHYVYPHAAGISDMPFKTAAEAKRIADALNAAYLRGQDDIRRGVRILFGCEEVA